MRIRRNIIAPLILTIGAVGSLVAVPAVTALTAVTPATTAVATGTTSPDVYRPHGVKYRARPAARRRFLQSAAGCWLSPRNGGKFAGKS